METNRIPAEYETLETIDFKRIIDLLRHNLWLILLSLLIGSLATFIAIKPKPPMYIANTEVSITYTDTTQGINVQKTAQSYLNLFSQGEVNTKVSDLLGAVVTPDQINITLVKDVPIIKVESNDRDPKQAVFIADTVADLLIEQNQTLSDARANRIKKDFNTQLINIDRQIKKLQDQLGVENKRALDEQLKNTQNKITEVKNETSKLSMEQEKLLGNATPETAARLKEVNSRINELQLLVSSYETLYSKLITTTEFQEEDPTVYNLKYKIDAYQESYTNLYIEYQNARLANLNQTATLVQISPALITAEPIQPNNSLQVVSGALAGLTLSLAFVFFADLTNKTIKSKDEVEKIFETPIFGQILNIPDHVDSSIYVINQSRSLASESFRLLRTNLEFSNAEKPLKTILITSSGTGEGKTFIACNLAASLAQADKKVLLIDADFRKPSIHKYTNLENRIGLSDLFLEGQTAANVIQSFEQLPNLKVLTSGGLPPNPTELLGSKKMQQILKYLSADFDFIVFDAPSLLISDSQILAPFTDGVLVVAVIGKTEAENARNAKQQIQRAHARLLGVVINRVTYNGKTNPYTHYYPQDESVESNQVPWNKLIDSIKSLPQKIRISRQKSEK